MILLIMFFVIGFILTIDSYQFFKVIGFLKITAYFSGKIFFTNLYQILKISKKSSNIVIL